MSARDMPMLAARLPHELDARFKAALAARKLTVTEAAREAVTQWIDGPTIRANEVAVLATPITVTQGAPANPLRALREAAGLSQSEAAERCGISRGAWANAEKAATATPAMVARARKAMVRK
jgi:hypothetical protein